jgi:NAD(P)H-nitrite reductase large subunit
VDKSANSVTTSSGETIKYDNLVLAPGGKAKKIPIDGADLEGVMTLRTIEDTKKIVDSVTKDSEIVIIGTSFIGMEVSMSLLKKEPKSVTLVGMDEIPFAAILGEDIGKAIMEASRF